MNLKQRVDKLEQRVTAPAATKVVVIHGENETEEQALIRLGIPTDAINNICFIHVEYVEPPQYAD